MKLNRLFLTQSFLVALFCLSACSAKQQPASPPVAEREFSAEDKQAARALSIGNSETMAEASTPYARALLCKLGIDVLAERVEETRGPAIREQQQAMRQARAYFGDQLRLLAQREGKSDAELRRDMSEAEEHHADPADKAQIAIACLRRLQGAS